MNQPVITDDFMQKLKESGLSNAEIAEILINKLNSANPAYHQLSYAAKEACKATFIYGFMLGTKFNEQGRR